MRIGINITKKVSFRLVQQEFSNVYHYDLPGAQTGPWEALVNELVDLERWWHSTDVTFVRASVWSAGGTVAQNVMLHQMPLSGTGNQATSSSMDRERALLIRWKAGVSSTGKPVYLRKWFHTCGSAQGNTFSLAVLQNTAEIPSADRAYFGNQADAFFNIGVAEAWNLCSESGRYAEGFAECHRFLEHHQLGDQWR